jgi:hypothetical protein
MPNKSYYDPDIAISLEMPLDWDAAASDQFPLLLLAPPQDNFRANMSFSVQELDQPTPEHFKAVIRQTHADRRRTFTDFQLVSEKRILQDNFPGHIEHYHWTMDDTHIPMTQLFALILIGPDALYGIHATCLRDTEQTYLPIFNAIIHSLRFIPT